MSCSRPASNARSGEMREHCRARTVDIAASRALVRHVSCIIDPRIFERVWNMERSACAMTRLRVVSMPIRVMALSTSRIGVTPAYKALFAVRRRYVVVPGSPLMIDAIVLMLQFGLDMAA